MEDYFLELVNAYFKLWLLSHDFNDEDFLPYVPDSPLRDRLKYHSYTNTYFLI